MTDSRLSSRYLAQGWKDAESEHDFHLKHSVIHQRIDQLLNQLLTSLSGTTAQRPTVGLRVGMQYFDATLGIPVFLKTTSPIVWVNASGAPV